MALVGVAVEKVVSCRPSTGASPQPLQPLDLPSPSTTAAAEERPRQIQPPNAHQNPSLLCSPRTKASYLCRRRRRNEAGLLYRRSTRGAPHPRARRWRRSGTPTGRGRNREDLFHSSAAATVASPAAQGHKPLDLLGPLPPTPTGKATAVPPPDPQAIGGGRDQRPRRRRPRALSLLPQQ